MQKTILVVEDEDDIRDFLKKSLTANNYKVAEASDGAEALEAVEKYFPDLVLLDFGLPKVSGEAVCVKIKREHPEIIVIALTGKSQKSDVVHGLQIGADDYITKPFSEDELIARIDAKFKTTANGHPQPKKEESELAILIVKESNVLLIIRLILTEVLFGISLILSSILFNIINSYINYYSSNISIFSLYFVVLVGFFLVNIGFVFFIALKWLSEYTEVSKKGVVKYSGILHKKEQKYACNFVEVVTLEQSLLGLIFNYGSIELYDPALKEKVYLPNIPNPKKYSEMVQKIISKEDNKEMPFIAQ